MSHNEKPASQNNQFTWIAPFYDVLARLYSFGQIRASKLSQIAHLRLDERVLYAGAGGAEDAIAAARKGAHVTVVELSPSMIKQAKDSLEKCHEPAQIDWVCGDVCEHQADPAYDVVVANYFLNVFAPKDMPSIFDALDKQLRTGGRLMIADFAPLRGGLIMRALQRAYFYAAVAAFRVIANNGWHPLYDYQALLKGKGYRIISVEDFALAKIGPRWYRSIVAEKHPKR
jgi:ubiquinone/menaquinone biosynthesis C-methylase UbiE